MTTDVPANRPHRDQAFSLVELLVVLGIIAVLIAILIPALSAARQMALTVRCQSNLRQCGVAMTMYATDHDQIVPFHFNQGNGAFGPSQFVFAQLAPYVNVPINGVGSPGYYPILQRTPGNPLECPIPNDNMVGAEYMTYMFSAQFDGLGNFQPYGPVPPGGHIPALFWLDTGKTRQKTYKTLADIKSPTNKIFLRDSTWVGDFYPYYSGGSKGFFGKHGKIVDVNDTSGYSPVFTKARATFNAVFFDGHTENFREADLGPTKYATLSYDEANRLHQHYYDITYSQ